MAIRRSTYSHERLNVTRANDIGAGGGKNDSGDRWRRPAGPCEPEWRKLGLTTATETTFYGWCLVDVTPKSKQRQREKVIIGIKEKNPRHYDTNIYVKKLTTITSSVNFHDERIKKLREVTCRTNDGCAQEMATKLKSFLQK